ncbi:acyltransferase domain-containing protein [Micromonospora sp. M12]
MTAVEATEDEVGALLIAENGRATVAAVNGPSAVVISGDQAAVARVAAQLRGRGRRTRNLPVSHAFHSPLLEPMLDRFAEVAQRLSYASPTIPVVSNVTGAVVTAFDADHWVRQARDTVRFATGVATLHDAGITRLLELGPDGVLSAMARECLAGSDATVVPLLRRDLGDTAAVATALATLHCAGQDVDWAGYFRPYAPRRIRCPPTPSSGSGTGSVRRWSPLVSRPRTATRRRGAGPRPRRDHRPRRAGTCRPRVLPPPRSRLAHARRARGPADHGDRVTLTSADLFDHPTPERLAGHLRAATPVEVAPTVATPVEVARTATAAPGEPIAIVAMACRYRAG